MDIIASLDAAFRDALSNLFGIIPAIIGAVLLLIIGWFIGKIVGALVTKALRAVHFDRMADKAEVSSFLHNAGVKTDAAAVVGGFFRWFIYLIFFIAAFNALHIPQVETILTDLLTFIPKIIVALVILLIGALAGKLLADLVRGSLRSMQVGNADLFANLARWAVIAFAAIMALDMVQIAPVVVNALWIAFLALVVGSLVLAFGLGGRHAARDLTLGRMLRSELEPGVEIEAGPFRGRVRTIGSLFTTLETDQGFLKVPNIELTGQRIMMSQQEYQQQVQTRDQMKRRARQALQQATQQRDGHDGRTAEPAGAGARTTVIAPADGHDETNGQGQVRR